jgi:ABC-type Zn2+ transport system substrate-binding protein/surface adhesin
MIKPILTAAALSFAAATAVSALPVSQTTSLRPLNFSDLIRVGEKNKNKNHNHDNHNNHDNHDNHNHGYHHGGRYYGHRYYARPYNWQTLGCVVVGPVWYCP